MEASTSNLTEVLKGFEGCKPAVTSNRSGSAGCSLGRRRQKWALTPMLWPRRSSQLNVVPGMLVQQSEVFEHMTLQDDSVHS